MERRLPVDQIRRLGFREQAIPWPKANLGPGDLAKIYSSRRAERKLAGTLIGQPELLSSDSPCWHQRTSSLVWWPTPQ
jgi:hypothetical protein